MDKRYQVFVSSTFADLQEERSKVFQVLMQLDCIPAGMEIFPAADEEQWDFIKKIIDDSDYYILILGGRYGSLTEDGISYTEKEFDYAMEKGIKILAFVHEDPDSIPAGKTDKDDELRAKLEKFRDEKVLVGRLASFWKEANELPGLVALSLPKTIKTYPATGWVRGSEASSTETLQDLNEIRKENEQLKKQISNLKSETAVIDQSSELADLSDTIEIKINYKSNSYSTSRKIEMSWSELFVIIGPILLNHPSDTKVKIELAREIVKRHVSNTAYSPSIENELFDVLRAQFDALGLVKVENSPTTKGGTALFWTLTKRGSQELKNLLLIKKPAIDESSQDESTH